MKAVFLCGCLEEGADGVGDYTFTLARHWNEVLGLPCGLVALNDGFVEQPVRLERQSIPLLRLPAQAPERNRLRLALDALSQWNPELVSLQLALFAYHPRGLPVRLLRWFRTTSRNRRTHVFFHEIWIGRTPADPWRQRLLGALQRLLIRRLNRPAGATVFHTSTPSYAQALRQAGIETRIVPVFSSIPLQGPIPRRRLSQTMFEAGLDPSRLPDFDPGRLWITLFGALHPEWDPIPILQWIATLLSPKPCLIHLGKASPDGAGIRSLRNAAGHCGLPLIFLGKQPPEIVSAFVSASDFALTSNPLELIGKSSSVACQLDHGLPVLVSRRLDPAAATHTLPRPPGVAGSILWFDPASPPSLEQVVAQRTPPADSVAVAAGRLAADLGFRQAVSDS